MPYSMILLGLRGLPWQVRALEATAADDAAAAEADASARAAGATAASAEAVATAMAVAKRDRSALEEAQARDKRDKKRLP